MAQDHNDKRDNRPEPGPSNGSVDQRRQGPTSIAGAEASELPDKGRGSIDTTEAKALGRKLPSRTGAIDTGTDVGLRAAPDIADAKDHGGRKHN